MTKLKGESILKRETGAFHKGKPITVELHPSFIVLKTKNSRTGYILRYDAAVEAAMKIGAIQKRTEKHDLKNGQVSQYGEVT